MANLEEANQARNQHSDLLRKLGAHAIAVDEIKRSGRSTFAVIAFFEKEPTKDLPQSLEVKSGKQTVQVPLVARVVEKFRPEKL